MHRRFTLANPRLRFIDEPSDEGGGSNEGAANETPQEGAQDDDGQEAEPKDDEPFDAQRALDKIKKLNSEARALRLRAQGRPDPTDERIKALEAENLRIRIGARHGLPDELIDRLKGSTEEEILTDAEKLLTIVGGPGKRPPSQRPQENLRGGGAPQVEPEETDPRKLAARIPRL